MLQKEQLAFVKDQIKEALKSQCLSSGEVWYKSDYSGRGMFGKTCHGIIGPLGDVKGVISETIKELRHTLGDEEYAHADFFGEAIDILMRWEPDNMGHDVIYYWRSLRDETTES